MRARRFRCRPARPAPDRDRRSAGHMGTDDVGEFDDEPQSGAERNDADHKAADRGRQSLAIVRGELADSCTQLSHATFDSELVRDRSRTSESIGGPPLSLTGYARGPPSLALTERRLSLGSRL
jgi:hypothetical protein